MKSDLHTEIAVLRLRARQYAWPLMTEAHALDAIQEHTQRAVEAAELLLARTLRPAGMLRAAVLVGVHEDPFTGGPIHKVSVDLAPGDADAAAWATKQLPDAIAEAGESLDCMVEEAHAAWVLPVLAAAGFGVNARLFMGTVADALGALGDVDVASRLNAAGMVLRDATAEDIDAIIALNRTVFTASPEHCWFGANTRYLDGLRNELTKALVSECPPRVFVDADGIAGMFEASLPGDRSHWGPSAGMGIVLGPRAQGRGLLRVLYRDTAERLQELGVPWFRGGTSQPAVLHLAGVMRRRPIAAHVRRGAVFSAAHFGYGDALD